jgi:hypothetical protein
MNHHRSTDATMNMNCCSMALLALLLVPLTASGADKVLLQLKLQHQFQFAGYYDGIISMILWA